MKETINKLAAEIHQGNVEAGWWSDLKYADKYNQLMRDGFSHAQIMGIFAVLGVSKSTIKTRNIGEILCLVHSEISEAMEGARKNLMDDKLPHRIMLEVELADAMIRILDIAGAYKLDLGGAIEEKREYNRNRSDHKIENRSKENGKKF